MNDQGIYRPRWASALGILALPHQEQRDYIDYLDRVGFNGFRVFAGHLGYMPQTASQARAALPYVLEYAAERGKYVEVVFLTDTKNGYDKEHHAYLCGQIVDDNINSLPEMANEPWHETQDDQTHSAGYLYNLARRVIPPGIPFSLGAAQSDESIEFVGGMLVVVHLDRSRDTWNMVRHIRELEAMSAATGKFVMNNEPIKLSSQLPDPAVAFALGVLSRGFELGAVHHTDWGLRARVPSEAEEEYDRAFIDGTTLLDTDAVLSFKNTGWPDGTTQESKGCN